MQEAEQPLGAGVFDTPTFSKPKQVMNMPTYSDVYHSKVKNTTHLACQPATACFHTVA